MLYMQKICTKYHCKKCDYKCSRKFLWEQHLKTRKHNGNIWKHLETKNMHICPCGKTYKTRGGFSKHKKKCTYTVVKEEIVIDDNKSNVEDLLHELIEDNKNLRSEIKNLKLGTTTYNQNLSINLFLNDKCKDAMTLTDFVENLHLSLKDLDFTNTQGYVEGISKIFIRNLNNMDVTERPIHCSDQKRLQFYVKKENKWEKDAEHEEIDKSIAKVSKKQILILTDWCKANPGYEDDPEKSEEYFKLVGRTMGPNDEKRLRQIKKILAENVKITQPKKEENIIIKD
jgi:hypothetical protein